jgi:hypothetical protein
MALINIVINQYCACEFFLLQWKQTRDHDGPKEVDVLEIARELAPQESLHQAFKAVLKPPLLTDLVPVLTQH